MIVADTSALVSPATVDVPHTVLDEFDIDTTETVIGKLGETPEYDAPHGHTADHVLGRIDRFHVYDVGDTTFRSSRIDSGDANVSW